LNIFTKFFSSSSRQDYSPAHDTIKSSLQKQFNGIAHFYTQVPLFFHDQRRVIEYMMLHPNLGIVLFSFFDYSLEELRGVTASAAKQEDKNADIQVQTDKSFLRLRLDEAFEQKNTPIHSILICTRLSEEEFTHLDKSFHDLIPQSLSLFKDSSDYKEKLLKLSDINTTFRIEQIQQSLFSEFLLPEQKSLMSHDQQAIVHLSLKENLLIHGLPGSGKSSVLIAKTLYEKIKYPKLSLIIFAPRACNVHLLQAMIFQFVENSKWGLNPADIVVSNFDSIQRRSREKEKYDLIACDDLNKADLSSLKSLLTKNGYLLCTSHYPVKQLRTCTLPHSFRLSPALSAACEGLEVDLLENDLVFKHGNTYMNTLLVLEKLLKTVDAGDIRIVHYDTQQRRELQTHINEYFTPISYLVDESSIHEGILLYPLNQLTCVRSPYLIIIIDEESHYDPVELISRAGQKSFILSESDTIYNTITQIKGLNNETD